MQPPSISVIMPAYNARKHIAEAVESVLSQDRTDWELIIIDDGSLDDTLEVLKQFRDPRIQIIANAHYGVSESRNAGIEASTGRYICFLDADDRLPKNSLAARATMLDSNPNLEFVDGNVSIRNHDLSQETAKYSPSFRGMPEAQLKRFRTSCFFGNSWMIRMLKNKAYKFDQSLTHAEDLHFYLSIANSGHYDYTNEIVVHYRKHGTSAMTDLSGMERGLLSYLKYARNFSSGEPLAKLELKYRLTRAICGSYFHNNQRIKSIQTFFKLLCS